MYSQYPASETALRYRVNSLRATNKYAEAENITRDFFAHKRDGSLKIEVLGNVLIDSGKFIESIALYKSWLESGKGTATDYNNAGWYSLFNAPANAESVSFLQKALNDSSSFYVLEKVKAQSCSFMCAFN